MITDATHDRPVAPATIRPVTRSLPVRRPPVGTLRLTAVLVPIAVLASVLGLVHLGDFYDAYDNPLAGLVGQDIATLCVGAPLLVAGAWLSRRGSVAGLLVWAAALFYLAYSYFFFVVGAAAVGFPLYLVIVALSLYGLLSLLVGIDPEAVAARAGPTLPRRPAAAFLFGTGVLFAVMWGGLSVGSSVAGKTLDPVVHLVVVADTCVLLPALVVGGWKLWVGSAWGFALAGILLVKVGLTAGTVAFGTALQAVWSGALATGDAGLLVLFGAMAVGAVSLAVPYLRSFRQT